MEIFAMEGALSYNVIYADYFKGKKIRAEFLKRKTGD
jgi:hypothetical protein